MADIGVLELKIESNAGKAASNLNKLADALSNVKNNAAGDLNLGKVATGVNAMAQAINGQGAGTVVKNLGTLLNAVAKFTNITKPLTVASSAIEAVKTAVAGFNIGNAGTQLKALREALAGEWKESSSIKTAMQNVADGAKALAEANAATEIKNAASALETWTKAMQGASAVFGSASDVGKSMKEITSSIQTASNSVDKMTSSMSSGMSSSPFGMRSMFKMPDHFEKPKDLMQPDGFNQASTVIKNATADSATGIQNVVNVLKELSQVKGTGKELTNIATGFDTISKSTKNAEALASAIRIDANALNRMKTVCEGFTLPSFDGLIQLAQSMKGNSDSSVYLKRIAESIEALKGGALSDAARGFAEINNVFQQMDANVFSNLNLLAAALKVLKGLGGIGSSLKSIAEGITAIAGATRNAEAVASAIRIDASAINRMKTVCDGFKLPSFNNLIKLAESMQANPASSVYMKRIADSIEILKAAGNGFKAPDLSGIKISSGAGATDAAANNVATSVQQIGDAVSETTSEMQQLKPATDQVMNSVADSANKTANTIADTVGASLPDTMSWRVGEEMTPVAGQASNAVDTLSGSFKSLDSTVQSANNTMAHTIALFQDIPRLMAGSNAINIMNAGMKIDDASLPHASDIIKMMQDDAKSENPVLGITVKPDIKIEDANIDGQQAQASIQAAVNGDVSGSGSVMANVTSSVQNGLDNMAQSAQVAAGGVRDLKVEWDHMAESFKLYDENGNRVVSLTSEEQKAFNYLTGSIEKASDALRTYFKNNDVSSSALPSLKDVYENQYSTGGVRSFEAKYNPLTDQFEAIKGLGAKQQAALDEWNAKYASASDEMKAIMRGQLVDVKQNMSEMVSTVQESAQEIANNMPTPSGPIDTTIAMPKTDPIGVMSSTLESIIDGTYRAKQAEEALKTEIEQPINSASMEEYVTKLDLLKEKLGILKGELAEGLGKQGDEAWSAKKINSYMLQIVNLEDQIEKLQNKYESLNGDSGMTTMNNAAIEAANEFLNANNQISAMQMKMDALKQKLGNGIINGTLDNGQIASLLQQIQTLQNKINNLTNAQNKTPSATGGAASASNTLANAQNRVAQSTQNVKSAQDKTEESTHRLKNAFNNLKNGMNKLPFVKLIKQMMRMAKMRALRYMIRELAKGFREGVENVYHYSEAIGGSFHESMDSAATALNQMKNSIGAAVAPALQALIPLFNTIVGWISTAANYLNQFFSLLSGKGSWTRALPVATKAFDEQKKAAKGASDSVKDMLADFDELNIIQQNGSGGGGGGSGSDTNYAEMFEEVNEFDGKIKDMVQWIEDHMETVEGIAKAIGIAILGWKVSKAFDGVLGTLGGIIAGGAILAIGLQVAFEGAYSAGLNGGFDTSSLLATIAGNVAAAVGGGIIGFKLAGPKGAAVGALIGLTIGIVTSIIAYKKGQNMAEEIARFGTIAMDAAQLKQSIQNMYSFDITPKIQLIGTTIENAEQAQNKLSADATLLSTKIKKVLIGVRVSGGAENELLELKKQCDQIIIDINDYLQNTAEGIHLLVQDVRIKDANGTDITDNILADVTESDRLIMSYMTKLGEEVAKAFDEGMKSGWANDEMDLMLANAERMARITTGSQELQLQMEYEAAQLDILSGVDLQNLDRDSMLELMSQLAQIEGEYTGKYVDLQKVSRSSMLNRASMLQRIAEDMDENDPLKEQYTAMAENLQNEALALTESVMREAAYGKFGIGSKNQELRRAMAESLRGTYYSSNAWQRYIVDLLREYDAEDEAQTQRAYEKAVQQVQTQLSSSTPNIGKIVEGINQIIVDSLGGASQDVIKGFEEAGGALVDILPVQTQQNLFQYLTERANNIFADAQDQKKFVDSVMLELYKGDKLRYAQLLESIGQSPWGMYSEALPKEFNGEEVDTTFLENIFADAAENLTASGLDLYDYVKDKYGSTTLATIVDAINKAVETTGQTRDEIYRLMFGDGPVPNVSGGLPPLANRLSPEGYRASNAGGPFGTSSERRMNAMQLVWNIEEGLNRALGGENLTPSESNMFVQPSGYTEDTDDRTANATEAMQQDIVTQNDKIDRVERLLSAVLSRLNAGLNVNMAPTSTGGRMVNGMLDAFTRVTGNN